MRDVLATGGRRVSNAYGKRQRRVDNRGNDQTTESPPAGYRRPAHDRGGVVGTHGALTKVTGNGLADYLPGASLTGANPVPCHHPSSLGHGAMPGAGNDTRT